MNCDQTKHVQAFYDGEMSAVERAGFEAHLKACAICSAELEDLRRLSTHLAAASIPFVSQEAIARFHRAANVAEERGVLRLAEWLTAAAAAVLVIGLTGLFKHDTTHASAPDVWEQAAVAYPTDHDPTVQSDVLQFAEWMRTDLSPSQKRDQR
ncbi:MAG TPA: zf-HC2 domain-containing protein [Tepidisphaeraceae bacterium]|jgi:anti-sigma factor RsiW|nr:zf-HC2 domain-containing protein [Tepidisphaeraceae bacterium]